VTLKTVAEDLRREQANNAASVRALEVFLNGGRWLVVLPSSSMSNASRLDGPECFHTVKMASGHVYNFSLAH
jgi:hypothetical protein